MNRSWKLEKIYTDEEHEGAAQVNTAWGYLIQNRRTGRDLRHYHKHITPLFA